MRCHVVVLLLLVAFAGITAQAQGAALGPSVPISVNDVAVPNTDPSQIAGIADPAGDLTLVYNQKLPSPKHAQVVVVRRPAGGAFGAPVTISDPANTGSLADTGRSAAPIGIDGSGNVSVAYEEQSGSVWGIWLRTAAPGGAFGPPVNIVPMTGTGTLGLEGIIVARNGDVAVVYHAGATTYARLRPAGAAAFGAAVAIDSGSGSSVSLGADVAGDMTVAYTRGVHKLYVATRTAGGSFTPGTIMSTPAALETAMTVEPAGRVTIFYRDDASPYHVHALVRPTAGGLFGVPQDLGADQGYEAVPLMDAAGDVSVGWQGANGFQLETRAAGAATFGPAETISSATVRAPWTGASAPDGTQAFVFTGQPGANFIQTATGRAPGQALSPPATFGGPSIYTSNELRAVGVGPGNVLLFSSLRPLGSQSSVLTGAFFDAAPPKLTAVTVPAKGVAGTPVTLSAATFDVVDGTTDPVVWSLGDGASATGRSLSHTYARAGTYTVSTTAADRAGNRSAVHAAKIVVAAAPLPSSKISAMASTHAHHRLRVHGTASYPKGVARVDVSISRTSRGHCLRVNARGTAKSRRGACKTFTWLAAKGTSTWSLTLRHGLPRGTWTVRSRATGAAGAREAALTKAHKNVRTVKVR